MGFTDVSLLEGGRAAWTVLGLPTEGQIGDARRVKHHIVETPTVSIDATVADVIELGPFPYVAAVLADGGVVVGALEPTVVDLPRRTRVAEVMIPAPSTIRPDLRVDEVARRLADDGLDHILVTTADGVLVGLVTPKGLHV
jgi:CBS-domain-containing membrane protein